MTTRRLPPAHVPLGIALGAGVLLTAGCGIELDAGDTVTESFAVEEFDEVEIDGAFEVTIVLGGEPSLEIDAGENIVDDLRIDQDGDRLSIGLRDGFVAIDPDLAARITTGDLSKLDVNGAVRTEIRDLDSDRLVLDLDGASRVEGEGSVRELVIDSNGASQVDFDAVTIDRVEIDIDGASDLDLTAATEITGELSGASTVDVSDDAQVNVRVRGASSIR